MKETHEPCKDKAQENLYRIGMFAAMNHVTIKALRYYDEQGLLAPAYVDMENGYEIVGNIRGNYIDGVWNKDSESDWLTEIQIPIKNKVH